MRNRSILLLLPVVAAVAFRCGDDRPPHPPDVYYGGGAGGTQSSFCSAYCSTLVTSVSGCAHYNDSQHCALVCGWYQDTVCAAEYTAFAHCVQGSTGASCYQSGTVWGLNIPASCSTAFNTFQTCVNDKNVGYCPYGS
jgi:hypothetical protein